MVDWGTAQRIALTVAGERGETELPGDLVALADHARERVVASSGLAPGGPLPAAEAVDRGEWIEANLADMRRTLDPVVDRMGEGLGALAGPLRTAGGLLLGAEVGALTGYMAQRVLGQYELALLEPDAPARLLFVAPNIRRAAVDLDADPSDLLTWIAYHEVTHAVQFSAVPWLRDHVAGLLRELIDSLQVSVNPAALVRLPRPDDLRALLAAVRDGGLVGAVAGPHRRAILDRVQAVMAMVEGHAEHVMDAAAVDVLPSLSKLRAALDRRRRERPPLLKLLDRLLGLDLKLRQYEVGRRFCDAVADDAGVDGLNRAWAAPAALPTLSELEHPELWLARM